MKNIFESFPMNALICVVALSFLKTTISTEELYKWVAIYGVAMLGLIVDVLKRGK